MNSSPTLLILGGSSELGIALAKEALTAGYEVVTTFASETGRERLARAVADFETGRCGSQATSWRAVALPFGDSMALSLLISELHGRCRHFVDFAHTDYESLVAAAQPSDVETYFRLNVSARAEIIREVARMMLARPRSEAIRGRMIYVSSTAAALVNPGQGFYAAAKLASEALYRGLGVELGGRGITTSILRLGYVAAGRAARSSERHGASFVARIPTRRLLPLVDVARTVLFLLSEAGSTMNANVTTLDGGLTACK